MKAVATTASTVTRPPQRFTAGSSFDGVGANLPRPDGRLKVRGEFAFSSDMWADGMLWGATVRSPHPSARIRSVDISQALKLAGVYAVLTHPDVPGRKNYGVSERVDQPVLADDVVRYEGEAIAIVAADHPETARRAAQLVAVDYEVLEPLTNPETALSVGVPQLHEHGNLVRHVKIRHGDVAAAREIADVVICETYEIGMQDQAFLGPESGLAIPAADGSVDLYVATQWLHRDRDQISASLGLATEQVRLTLGGVGGAFGGREDLSMQIHACLLALHTGKPVKMVYSREESFVGHFHRHPARLRYEHGATRDGRLTHIVADILLDGGAYESESPGVAGCAAYFAAGPYEVPNVTVDSIAVFTNNPPCGAMRGYGFVQACFAYESQMDKLAAALGSDPLDLRQRNAMSTGTTLPTGQAIDGPAPVAELIERVRKMPLPPVRQAADLLELPGGAANATHGEGVRRGVGYAVGAKAIGYSGGFEDYSTARVRLSVADGAPLVEVHTAGVDVGQGLVTVQAQIARTELRVEHVTVRTADTQVGNAGSTDASRQTWMTGGAVMRACRAVSQRVLELAAERFDEPVDHFKLGAGEVISAATGAVIAPLTQLLDDPIEETREFRHRKTYPVDPETGQGETHYAFAFVAHRAVVDVDTELGLVKVVEIATAQDVGKAINPQAVEGQIEGGASHGLGFALMEEVQVEQGRRLNRSFTDYLIPTTLDMPPVRIDILEYPHPDSPYGLNGVGEPPVLSSTPAIVNALRNATGQPLQRIPVWPEELAGTGTAPHLQRSGGEHAG
jgi:xanthine dehydrogenase D subunit